MQDRAFRAKRSGDAGDRIGTTRPRGSDHATQFTGLAGIAIRGMRRGLLMTHVDDTYAFIKTAIVDIDNMTATKRKYGIDAFGLERLGDQVTAGNDGPVLGLRLQGIGGGIGYRWFFSYC